jgi:diguanylate cyclase (GGDEF)-like protein
MNKLRTIQQLEYILSKRWKLEQLSRICTREIVNALNCDECAFIQTGDQNAMVLASKGVLSKKKDINKSAALDSFLSKKKSIITGEVANCPSVPGVPYGSCVNSIIWTPITINSLTGGILYAGTYAKNAFSSEDSEFMEDIGANLTKAFSNDLLINSGDEALDEITGAYSKKLFITDLNDILASAPDSVSLIMIDLDDFQQYIKNQEAQAGDIAYQNIVSILMNNMRPLDRLYHYGKTEFIILLKDIRKPAAVGVAQRLNNLVMQTGIRGETPDQPDDSLTISSGVVTYPEDGRDSSVLIKSLHAALARAKQSGGNKICHFEITG